MARRDVCAHESGLVPKSPPQTSPERAQRCWRAPAPRRSPSSAKPRRRPPPCSAAVLLPARAPPAPALSQMFLCQFPFLFLFRLCREPEHIRSPFRDRLQVGWTALRSLQDGAHSYLLCAPTQPSMQGSDLLLAAPKPKSPPLVPLESLSSCPYPRPGPDAGTHA